jgi:AsmA-like C-terminal region/Protein of unknown function
MSYEKLKNKLVKLKTLKKSDIRSLSTSLVLELGSVILTLSIIWFAALGILMNRPSVNLAFAKPHYEHWFSEAFDGKTTEIESYSARWVQERRVIEVRAKGIHINSDDGASQIIENVSGQFRIQDNLWAPPEIVSLSITGGALTIVRETDKRMQVSLGTPEASGNVGALWQSETGTASSNLLGQIEKITVNNADIYFVDKSTNLSLEFIKINGEFSFIDDNIVLEAVGVLKMDSKTNAAFRLELQTTPDMEVFNASLYVNNLVPARIAPTQDPTAILSNLEAPIDLNATIKTRKDVGVEDLQLSLIAGAGLLKTGTTYKPFSHARIEAHYDASAKNIQIQAVEIESEAFDIIAKGRLQNPRDGIMGFVTQSIGFAVDIVSMRINPGQKYNGPISLKSSTVQGALDLRKNSLEFETLKLDFGTFQTDLSASLQRNDSGDVTGVKADGAINGIMSKKQLLGFWPNNFALGARNWIENSLQTGKITNLKVHADLDANDIKKQQIANEHLNVKFDVHDGEVRYMRKMPWFRNAIGYGELQGNKADFFVTSGTVDGLTIKSGKVTIPKLSPHGGDFTIDLQGMGTVNEMLRVSNFPPFEFSTNFGIDPNNFGGNGAIKLHVTRPLLEYFDQSRILYELTGDFTDVSIPVGIGGFDLNDGQISIQADRNGIEISGPIKLGSWQTTLDWQKPLEYKNTPAHYTLVGTITRNDLDAFGIGLRRHFGGEFGVDISGEGDGLAIQQADIFADFTRADVNIGSLWVKPKGAEGKLSGRLVLNPEGGGSIENLAAIADGLDIKGSIALAKDFRLVSMELATAKIDGLIDAKIFANPTDEGVLTVDFDGAYLNVEPWVNRAFEAQTSSVFAPINLSARLDEIALDENYVLAEASAQFVSNGSNVTRAQLIGTTKDGAFLAEIKNSDVGDYRSVNVEIPDASIAMLTLLGLDSIKGGKLEIEGKLPPNGAQGGLTGGVSLEDFTLVHAPAFTQILSLASLQGLVDTLGGSGLTFDELKMQFAWENGVLKVRDGRASGPALGLTGEGDISIADRTVDFDGVLVPSYTVNSILGDIPLVGDIIVGKKGEGMFALNYSVNGPFAKTQIMVNPLSALTPGFLRRIFDVKRDKIENPNIVDLIKNQETKDK